MVEKIEYHSRYVPVDDTKGSAIDIGFNAKIEVDSERLIHQGWQFTNAQDRYESLLDNLEMFKESSDALVDKMSKMIPDWESMEHSDAVMNMNKDFRRAYRAWRRARSGIDSTLATLAADNSKEANSAIYEG